MSHAAVVLSTVLLSAGLLSACTGAQATDGRARVVRVIDGDTIIVSIDHHHETVRLLGINTPETKDPRKPVECFGPEASERTKELLPPGTTVRLERDREPRDRYGRLLAWVHRLPDGLFVNDDLVAQGFARVLVIPPNGIYAGSVEAAERSARAASVGLWSACAEASR